MGASVTHGKRLARERTRYHDGSEEDENVAIEGDCHFPSYGTVEEADCICERHGVPRDSWPIYYDLRGEIVLDDVSDKCQPYSNTSASSIARSSPPTGSSSTSGNG